MPVVLADGTGTTLAFCRLSRVRTAAEMLSCGEASAPAIAVLRRRGARFVTVPESSLLDAPRVLVEDGGPATTPSGAGGLAGTITIVADQDRATDLGLDRSSRILILVTECALEGWT
jgi:diaminopropionate ammonia-lyase